MSVYYVTGIQGGVGKSFVTFLTLETFKNDNPLVIDTDTDNPNVYQACRYKDENNNVQYKHEAIKIDTDTIDGWEKLMSVIDNNRDRQIIINTPARNKKAIKKYGEFLDALVNNGIDVVSLFVINNKQDSINHLRDYLEYVHTKICVIKNQGTSEDIDFEKFDNCSYAKNGIANILLKTTSQSIQNEIFNNRKIIEDLFKDGSMSFRIIIESWFKKNGDTIKNAIDMASVYNAG